MTNCRGDERGKTGLLLAQRSSGLSSLQPDARYEGFLGVPLGKLPLRKASRWNCGHHHRTQLPTTGYWQKPEEKSSHFADESMFVVYV